MRAVICPTNVPQEDRTTRILRKWVWGVQGVDYGDCEDVLARSPCKEGLVALTSVRMTVAAFSCQSHHRLLRYRKTLYPSSNPPRGRPHSMSDGDGVSKGPFSTEFPLRSAEAVRFASWLVPSLLPIHRLNSEFCLHLLLGEPKWDKSLFCWNEKN